MEQFQDDMEMEIWGMMESGYDRIVRAIKLFSIFHDIEDGKIDIPQRDEFQRLKDDIFRIEREVLEIGEFLVSNEDWERIKEGLALLEACQFDIDGYGDEDIDEEFWRRSRELRRAKRQSQGRVGVFSLDDFFSGSGSGDKEERESQEERKVKASIDDFFGGSEVKEESSQEEQSSLQVQGVDISQIVNEAISQVVNQGDFQGENFQILVQAISQAVCQVLAEHQLNFNKVNQESLDDKKEAEKQEVGIQKVEAEKPWWETIPDWIIRDERDRKAVELAKKGIKPKPCFLIDGCRVDDGKVYLSWNLFNKFGSILLQLRWDDVKEDRELIDTFYEYFINLAMEKKEEGTAGSDVEFDIDTYEVLYDLIKRKGINVERWDERFYFAERDVRATLKVSSDYRVGSLDEIKAKLIFYTKVLSVYLPSRDKCRKGMEIYPGFIFQGEGVLLKTCLDLLSYAKYKYFVDLKYEIEELEWWVEKLKEKMTKDNQTDEVDKRHQNLVKKSKDKSKELQNSNQEKLSIFEFSRQFTRKEWQELMSPTKEDYIKAYRVKWRNKWRRIRRMFELARYQDQAKLIAEFFIRLRVYRFYKVYYVAIKVPDSFVRAKQDTKFIQYFINYITNSLRSRNWKKVQNRIQKRKEGIRQWFYFGCWEVNPEEYIKSNCKGGLWFKMLVAIPPYWEVDDFREIGQKVAKVFGKKVGSDEEVVVRVGYPVLKLGKIGRGFQIRDALTEKGQNIYNIVFTLFSMLSNKQDRKGLLYQDKEIMRNKTLVKASEFFKRYVERLKISEEWGEVRFAYLRITRGKNLLKFLTTFAKNCIHRDIKIYVKRAGPQEKYRYKALYVYDVLSGRWLVWEVLDYWDVIKKVIMVLQWFMMERYWKRWDGKLFSKYTIKSIAGSMDDRFHQMKYEKEFRNRVLKEFERALGLIRFALGFRAFTRNDFNQLKQEAKVCEKDKIDEMYLKKFCSVNGDGNFFLPGVTLPRTEYHGDMFIANPTNIFAWEKWFKGIEDFSFHKNWQRMMKI